MAKPIEDAGATARAVKPLALPVYDPARLPDPAACTAALIIVNDRTDGSPRLRLALSNGASWDRVALSVDGAAPGVDLDALAPIMRRLVAQTLPAVVRAELPPAPAPVMLTAEPAKAGEPAEPLFSGFPAQATSQDAQETSASSDDSAILAQAMIEMAAQVTNLMSRVHDLEYQVDYLKRNAAHRDGVTVNVEAA